MNSWIFAPDLHNWLIFTLLLFSLGLYGILTRRSAVGILISIELMLNAGALNFVIFNRFMNPSQVDGHVMAIFVIGLAAAEILAAMAILVMLFRQIQTADITQLSRLKH